MGTGEGGLVAFVGRIAVRARWRTYTGTAVLLAVTVGLSLFSLAGARRTQSSYDRFLRSVHPSTISIGVQQFYDARLHARIAAFPEVVRSSTYVGVNTYLLRDGRPRADEPLEISATLDDRFVRQDRFTATTGREFVPTRADEVMVNEFAAERLGYRVGDRLQLGTYAQDQIERPDFLTNVQPPRLSITATVVGIGVTPEEVLQDDGDRTERLFVTPAFTRQARPYTYSVVGLVLRHGDRDIAAVKERTSRLLPPGTAEFRVTSVDAFHARQALRPLAIALGLFGLIAGVAGVVLTMQSLARAVRLDRKERAVLRALGAPSRAIVAASLVAPATAVLAGVTLAATLAVAASPLMPIGPVRRVEVARGVDVDAGLIALGAAVVALLLLTFLAVLGWRERPHRVRARRAVGQAPRIVEAMSSAGIAPPALTGVRFALEPSDAVTAAPSRSVIAGAAIAIAALVGATTFGASLRALVDRPHLYGWDWDATIIAGDGFSNMPLAEATEILGRDPEVAEWSGAHFGFDVINGHDTPVLGMTAESRVVPTIVDGRFLRGPDEIVLGQETARLAHAHIGDRILLGGSGNPRRRATVVGTAVLPTIGMIHVAHTSLGVGAIVEQSRVPGVDRDITGAQRHDLGPSAIFVRFSPGTDASVAIERLRTTTQPLSDFSGIETVANQRPAEIVNSTSVGNAPIVLAVALLAGAMVSLALMLVGSVKRHRRDLSILKALGFTPRQLAATVSWHATSVVLVGVVIGAPLGAVLGRFLWSQFARQLDVVVHPHLPVLLLLGIALGAIVVGNAVAVMPSRAARRVPVARELDAE